MSFKPSIRETAVAAAVRTGYKPRPNLSCRGVRIMWRLWIMICALLFLGGCATDADRKQWDEFWKDARGDNMKMQSGFPDLK